eukprot:c28454_g1_i1 orf=312-2213(+)
MEVHLRELFGMFQQQFGLSPPGLGAASTTSLLKIDGSSAALIKAIFRAAAALHRSNPWKRFKAPHLFGVKIGKDSEWPQGRQPFCCVQFAGGGGMGDLVVNLFRSEDDAVGMTGIGSGGQVKMLPSKGLLRLAFVPEAELSAGNRKMIKSLGLDIAGPKAFPMVDGVYSTKGLSNGFPSFRNPSLEELRWLYACLRALTQVHSLLQQVDGKGRGRTGSNATFEEFTQTVDVQWPSEDAKPWDVSSVRVSYPPRDDREEQSSPPGLAEQIDASKEMVSFSIPRQCAMCERDVPANCAPRCSRCKAVIYCGHACQKQHWKEIHKGSCELYKAMIEREEELELKGFLFPCLMENACKWLESLGLHGKGMWRRMCECFKQCPYGLLPIPEGGGLAGAWGVERGKYPADGPLLDYIGSGENPAVVLLSGWAEYYDVRGLPLSSPVATFLSFPLSLYHVVTALSVTTKNLLAKGREVVVHYLGPEGELDWLPAFSELGNLLSGSSNLHIMMIGPEVPSSLSRSATSLGERLKVTFVKGLYQEEANSLPSPQVVVAFNSGLETYTSWMGALEVIKAQAVSAFFTDNTETCCANAKQVLRATGLHISYPVTPNPFRSPVRKQMPSVNLPGFSNGFVFGVNT